MGRHCKQCCNNKESQIEAPDGVFTRPGINSKEQWAEQLMGFSHQTILDDQELYKHEKQKMFGNPATQMRRP